MILVIQTLYPLKITENININVLTVFKTCNTGTFLIAHIGCVFLLIFCAAQTFRGRKLPWKFNESKYIAFGMFSSTLVKLMSIPIGLNLEDPVSKNMLLCLVITISNFLLFGILNGFKIKLILFYPEKNTIECFGSVTSEHILSFESLESKSVSIQHFNTDINLPTIREKKASKLFNVRQGFKYFELFHST